MFGRTHACPRPTEQTPINVYKSTRLADKVRTRLLIVIIVLAGGNFLLVRAQEKSPQAATSQREPLASQIYTEGGISVDFSIEPVSSESSRRPELVTGTEARVRFRIHDAGNQALSNLHPSVWLDKRESAKLTDARSCREKIQSFLQPSFAKRASLDLNSYFILALNHEPNISVIDPFNGFGGSKLYALIPLAGTGADWVISPDKQQLYVSIPSANQIAVVDTVNWKTIANRDAGPRPGRLVLQSDGRYLWIANDENNPSSGVTVLDTVTLKTAAHIVTGAGPHDILLTDDDRLAFVTNKFDDSVTVVDVRSLAVTKTFKVGRSPVALAYSALARTVYVASAGDGIISAVDAGSLNIAAQIKTEPGLRTIRVFPSGRFGLAVNEITNRAFIFDATSNRLRQSLAVGPGADQITFTKEFAYVRAPGSEYVTMIRIADLDRTGEVGVTRFPAGQKTPKDSPASSLAGAMIPIPGDEGVLVANPADRMIYFYTEGMAAPMGSFQNYGRDPKALLILENALTETGRGVYTTTIRLPEAGPYDVAFLLDSPRLVNCFSTSIAENPAAPKSPAGALAFEPLPGTRTPRVGESFSLRFRVIDTNSNQPKANLADVSVLVFLAPGIWQQREIAKPSKDGIYETAFVPPQAGVYYVYFQVASLQVPFSANFPLILQAARN
jgi:YVTN family beta-propeller protein